MYLKRFKAQFYTVKGAIKFQNRVKVYTSCIPHMNALAIYNNKRGVSSKVHPCTGTKALYRLYGP